MGHDAGTAPRVSPRTSSTPWNNGVSHAARASASGNLLIGKNTPENRNSGVMTKRNSTLKVLEFFRVAAYAMIGAANPRPVNTAAGIASTTDGDLGMPKPSITSTNAEAIAVNRTATHASSPRTRSDTRIGVAM